MDYDNVDSRFKFENPVDALRYMLSKKAIFTLVSEKTGKHFTFKTYQFHKSPEYLYVKTRTGQFFSDIAVVTDSKKFRAISYGKKNTRSFKAFSWILRYLLNGIMPPGAEVYHHGRCGNCGRVLTRPESIKRGIGPECNKKYGLQGGV